MKQTLRSSSCIIFWLCIIALLSPDTEASQEESTTRVHIGGQDASSDFSEVTMEAVRKAHDKLYLYKQLLHDAQAVVSDTSEANAVADVKSLQTLVRNAQTSLAKAKSKDAKKRFGNKHVKQEVKQAKNSDSHRRTSPKNGLLGEKYDGQGSCWSVRLDGKYIQEQHGSTDECYDFDTAKATCEAANDCHGIATQSNVCSGKYRVSHGSTATLLHYANWASYNLWAYTLDRSCLSSENLALGKTVTGSSYASAYGDMSVVTDGLHNDKNTHSHYEVAPWQEIDLGENKEVALTRTTFIMKQHATMTARNNGFTITVDGEVCGSDQPAVGWQHGSFAEDSDQGSLTTDTVCGSILVGAKVRLSLPTGGKRFLGIGELEVYGPAALAQSTCYSNSGDNVYPFMNRCLTCSGPGPSQCLSCVETDVFVMWNNTTQIGSCATWSGSTATLISIPGQTTTELQKQVQIYTKFVVFPQIAVTLQRPDDVRSDGTVGEVVGLRVWCKGFKRLVCSPGLSPSGAALNVSCTTSKGVELIKIRPDTGAYGGVFSNSNNYDKTAAQYIGFFADSTLPFWNPCAPLTVAF